MARKKSFERELVKEITSSLAGSRRGRKNPFGRGAGGVFWTLCVVLVLVLFQLRNGFESLKNEAEPRPTETTSNSFGETTSFNDEKSSGKAADVPERETVKIERCVDGDTFVVRRDDGSTERVRLIGANTPETVKPNWPVEPFGPEASAFSKRRVQEANGVATLVADGDRRDRYERRLAFLFLADSEISLNEELARAGLAKVETKYRYSTEMKERLRAAENDAKQAGRGMYAAER